MDVTLKNGTVYVFGDVRHYSQFGTAGGNKILITRANEQSGIYHSDHVVQRAMDGVQLRREQPDHPGERPIGER